MGFFKSKATARMAETGEKVDVEILDVPPKSVNLGPVLIDGEQIIPIKEPSVIEMARVFTLDDNEVTEFFHVK